MLVGMVADTFDINGRGVVVATDTTYEQLPRNLKFKIGDPIELRRNDVVLLRTSVAGIEHCSPWTPKQLFGFLLPRDVSKEAVPMGAEVWTGE
ncbi:MAG TPA: hypothetical protein VN688_08105 [Gemmataceae bacterium]|nr:hypothetical protein [Gemmataceae bacterium]